ncbi:MAG: alpha-amylase family glycosyl hydrolase [Bacteroidota bacterium]
MNPKFPQTWKSIVYLSITALLIISCNKPVENQQESPEVKSTWPNAVNYEIFVQSFYDSNGDGIGDIEGMTSKLDYLQDLGIEGIWLMPINPSPSYHKYDVVNYKDIHPDYGTLEQFKNFVKEAHNRGIHVVMDLVINHTGADHPWFKSALEGNGSEYRDYYVWADKDSIANEIAKKETSLDSDNITQWHAPRGDSTAEHYYGFFWGGMPDLNYDNPEVRKEVYEIGRFWLTEIGVDGFRLDAAKHIYPDDRAVDNHNFWIEFRSEMEKAKSDVYLVGEVWSDAETVAPFLKGLPALFNFDMGYAIIEAVNAGRDTMLVQQYKEINDFYNNVTEDFIDATFIRNHDQNRIMNEVSYDEQKARMAASILLTLPGSPYLYYGEEIGMRGEKPDEFIREPFLWDKTGVDQGQTSWRKAKYSTDTTVVPLNQQMNDPQSMYAHYKKLITLRKESEVLTFGGIETTAISSPNIISFVREHQGEQTLVLHNVSDEQVEIALPEGLNTFTNVHFSTAEGTAITGGSTTLPAYTTVVIKP